MVPSLLITFREVLEASLITAAVLGMLIQLGQRQLIKTVWLAAGSAAIVSILIIAFGSFLGVEIKELYEGEVEAFTEGILMITSAGFITWAVFFLHKYFTNYKKKAFQKIKESVVSNERRSIFALVFFAVLREGFEIALFLSTVYFSSKPIDILSGAISGMFLGILTAATLTLTAVRLPISYAFKSINLLLIFFAAGLLTHGVMELSEINLIPETTDLTIFFIPNSGTFFGALVKGIFGLSQEMNITEISVYILYVVVLCWWVFIRKEQKVS